MPEGSAGPAGPASGNTGAATTTAPAAAPGTAPIAGQMRSQDGKFTNGKAPKIAPADPAAPPGELPPEVKPFFKRKLNILGQEKEYSFKDENELTEALQRALGSQAKSIDVSKKEKAVVERERQLQQFWAALEERPIEVMEAMKIDFRKHAGQRLAEEAKLAAMSEEQREAYVIKKENERFKVQEAERQKQEQAKAYELEVDKHAAAHTKLFKEALAKTTLPKTPHTAGLMADIAIVARENGDTYTAEEMARVAEETVDALVDSRFSRLSGKPLLDKLGPALLQRIMDASNQEYQRSRSQFQPKTAPPVSEKMDQTRAEEPIDEYEFRRRLRDAKVF